MTRSTHIIHNLSELESSLMKGDIKQALTTYKSDEVQLICIGLTQDEEKKAQSEFNNLKRL